MPFPLSFSVIYIMLHFCVKGHFVVLSKGKMPSQTNLKIVHQKHLEVLLYPAYSHNPEGYIDLT